MTVAELIEKLRELPPDARVDVLDWPLETIELHDGVLVELS